MKRIIGIICLLAIASVSFAQSKNQLKGPAAKNAKAWEKSSEAQLSALYVAADQEKTTGPAAKNAKAWEKDGQPAYQPIVASGKMRKLKGPRYKNYKHWDSEGMVEPVLVEQPVRKEQAREKAETGRDRR